MSKTHMSKKKLRLLSLLGVIFLLVFGLNSFIDGFCPVYFSPMRKITYVSVSPTKSARIFVSYYRFGDKNYDVLLQKKSTCSAQSIYKSPDLDYPIETEKVLWATSGNSFKFISKNSGNYSAKTDPSERLLWCYDIESKKMINKCW
jgi:hypothetical protein